MASNKYAIQGEKNHYYAGMLNIAVIWVPKPEDAMLFDTHAKALACVRKITQAVGSTRYAMTIQPYSYVEAPSMYASKSGV